MIQLLNNHIFILLVLTFIILILTCISINKQNDEYYINDYQTLNTYRRTPFTKQQYDQMSKVDPGFGLHMWQFESAPKWDPNTLDALSKQWQPGTFGQLVSYLEDRNMAPHIKNLSV